MEEAVLIAERPEAHPGVGILRLNRPRVLNAINGALLTALVDTLSAWDADPGVRVVVIGGEGRGFAAGADIAELARLSPVEVIEAPVIAAWDRIQQFSKPLIAAVHGFALGGGLELAMSCDLIVAAEGAKLGQPEIKLGLIPGAGGTQRLTRAIGAARAMEIILTGDAFSAESGLAWGLINRVVPRDALWETALGLADKIADGPPVAIRLAKESVRGVQATFLNPGLLHERRLFATLFATEDQKEGTNAFLEKRPPKFQGR